MKMFTIYSIVLTLVFQLIPSSFDNIKAQIPEKMSYQAVIRDENNKLVISQQLGIQISILQGAVDGNSIYTETLTPHTNANGLVSIEIGTGITSDNFSLIDWRNSPHFIKIETDLEGGTNYTITGVSQRLSVPYAFHAQTADQATNLSTELLARIEALEVETGIRIQDVDGNSYS